MLRLAGDGSDDGSAAGEEDDAVAERARRLRVFCVSSSEYQKMVHPRCTDDPPVSALAC